MSNVKIHLPVQGLHNWGIEYNYEPYDRSDSDANTFVQTVNQIRKDFPGIWFHQTGATIESHEIGFRGYQFFEYWGPNEEDETKEMAARVAAVLECLVEN